MGHGCHDCGSPNDCYCPETIAIREKLWDCKYIDGRYVPGEELAAKNTVRSKGSSMKHVWKPSDKYTDEMTCVTCYKSATGYGWAAHKSELTTEDCTGSSMKRKDLKPGDVFSYKTSPHMVFYVSPRRGPIESHWTASMGVGEDLDREILRLSEDTTTTTPSHYVTGGIEAIDAIEAWGLGFRLANVIKYVARAGKKQGVDAKEDLVKARNYLSREIAALEGRRAWE